MVDTVQVQAGTTIAISATLPSVFSTATGGYPSLTYTTVGEVVDFAAGGAEWATASWVPLASDTTRYLKSVKSFATDTYTIARDDDDAGQIAMETAKDAKTEVAIEVTNPDGSIDYYTGFVLSNRDTRGGAEAVIQKTVVVQPTRDTVTQAAPTA